MSTNIDAQNALQIREKPMEVYIGLQVGSTATISTYAVTGQVKSDDSTLGNSSWAMRTLADLAGDGFLLDGSAEWYDSTVTPSENNGKLGVRGDIGETITVTITAGSTLTAVTIASSGVSTITKGADTYTATGNDVITINSTTATLVFTPIDSDTRVEINYIIPGIIFNITNDTLISCTLALRGNLDVKDHTWEESEIEVKMYYPHDISSSLAYIQNDWPITYQAGYDSDLSPVRKFYLSEPIVQEKNVITIKGVDASHLLDNVTLSESEYDSTPSTAHSILYKKFCDTITRCGIKYRGGGGTGWFTATQRAVLPEISARDFVSAVMNLTLSHKRGSTYYGIQFVDAGIPTIEYGDGKTYGNTWTIYKSDCGEWAENYEQNISNIVDTNSERKFNESFVLGSLTTLSETTNFQVNQIIENDFDGYYGNISVQFGDCTGSLIASSPERVVSKITSITNNTWKKYKVQGSPFKITGGVNKFTNSNGFAGITVEMDPIVYGAITDNNGETVFNYPSLFNRSLRTGSFTWKGDPRMQPLDYINVTNDTGDGRGNITARITGIELTHEEGGTSAKITWREWS